MAAYNPPTEQLPIFDNSVFNSINGDTVLTVSIANLLYLRKTFPDIATALETFSAGILTNNIQSLTTSSTLDIGSSQISGILNIGTETTRTGRINICSANSTAPISIQTNSTLNSDITPAIEIGTSSSTKTIKIGTASSGVNLSTLRIVGAALNNITESTGDVLIGSAQTSGNVFIGAGAGISRSGTVAIATAPSTNCPVTILTGTSASGSISMYTGNTSAGVVNIATGTGATQTTTVNISSGSTTGAVTIGNTNNSIVLNAPTTVKTIKQVITYLTTQTNTLTVSDIIASNIFGSTYSLASPSTANDIITINIPTPTSAMEGITIVFRKVRGVLNISSTNWTFTCSTSSIVPTGLTAGATPTLSSFNVNNATARFIVLGYSGSYYYFGL